MTIKQALKEKRFACFYVNREAVYDGDPDAVAALLAKTLILRCEFRVTYDRFEYEACSPLFDPVPEGSEMPRLQIRRHPLGGVPNCWSLEFEEAPY